MSIIDPLEYRHAAAQFLTGVTVVTTLDSDGRPVGLTANSFSSVSLEPPLVLFCLGVGSDTNDAFDSGHGFVVNVLAGHQVGLATHFAAKTGDRFDGIVWRPGHRRMPLLDGVLAVFECDPYAVYEAGDHRILVGEVVALQVIDDTSPSLGYFRSTYILGEVTPG